MENYKLVMPEHLNHYGYLFGGKLLSWVDEFAWIAASAEFPDCRFVTIGMDHIEFKKPVKSGSILQFLIARKGMGKSSIQYEVTVTNQMEKSQPKTQLFHTTVSFVNIGKDGKKQPIG